MGEQFDWIKRDRGILTRRDREILVGQAGEDLDDNALNQRYYNIRNRVRNSIYDFYFLSNRLPVRDIEQIFEPAYEWSIEKRKQLERGPAEGDPDFTPFLRGLISFFELFGYGLSAGGKQETQLLLEGLPEQGIEHGYRQYQHDNRQTYQEIDVTLSIEYGNLVLRDNYLRAIWRGLTGSPSDKIEQIARLSFQRKIPPDVASNWIKELTQSPSIG